MKFLLLRRVTLSARRSPCGERGLKYIYDGKQKLQNVSLPVRGAWIEIRITSF